MVALLGARQIGKTTLARTLARTSSGPTAFFDLEDPRDLARLADPMLALEDLRGLVVLDEVQRRPELFPALRVLADRPRGARFLALGSASPELLRQASESLAGRIAFHTPGGLALDEVGQPRWKRLWEHAGAELDLLVVRSLEVIHAGRDEFPLARGVRAVPLAALLESVRPLRR